MEARAFRAALLTAALWVSAGASYRTPNFVVQTSHPDLAQQFAKAAERYRRELAVAWLGKPMPEWSRPCLVTAHVGPHRGAGGATTFLFDGGEVYGWRMTIQGSAQRILDSVLPHEITHMVFACRFRSPLPRWADEGGATSVEHPAERAKHHRMLTQFLRSGRGIAFGRMFAMKEYPADIMPLYAQGYTLTEFLIQHGGRRRFLDFLGDGMQSKGWSAATQRHYGFRDLAALQNGWLDWVGRGFPSIEAPGSRPGRMADAELLAGSGKRSRPGPNLIYRIRKEDPAGSDPFLVAVGPDRGAVGPVVAATSVTQLGADRVSTPKVAQASGWRAAGERSTRAAAAVAVGPAPAEPVRTQVTHPQPIQRPRQTILRWSRP